MQREINYYLKLGCDEKIAKYFAEGTRTIVKVVANDDYTLTLTFNNGEVRIYDAKHLFSENSVFNKIKNRNNFKRVYLDDSHCVSWDIDPNVDSNIVWNNKLDLCPDSCYIDSVPLDAWKEAI